MPPEMCYEIVSNNLYNNIYISIYILLTLAEPAYHQCPPSNSFEKKLPTICTSREVGLILHWVKRQRWVCVFGFTMPRRESQERNAAWERVWSEKQ